MGTMVILTVYEVSPDLQIDIKSANSALMALGMGELYEEFENDPSFNGPFKMSQGSLLIAQRWDSYFAGYQDSTMIWGCFGEIELQEFARHVTVGKVVFQIDTEGAGNEWWVCTPGQAREKKPQF